MMFSKAELARRTNEARPILERLTAAGCKFMQVEMPDNNGVIRGKLVTLEKGLSASGLGATNLVLCMKGGDKVCFTSPFSCFDNGFPKFVALPDLSTAVALPWKRDVAAVLCDYYMDDGSSCVHDPRQILRSAEATLEKMGYSVRISLEYELYIVIEDDSLMRAGRYDELLSFGRDYDVLTFTRVPSYENLAKEFMTRCNAVGIKVDTWHTEGGHGMFEYTFEPQSALKAADDAVRARLILKQVCSERGLVATYMVAKFFNTGDTYSGCHHNFSLARGKQNVFWDDSTKDLSAIARHSAAGILKTMPDFNIIYRPWVNSFRRMDAHWFNAENASWARDNHLAGVRVVTGAVPDALTRFEHRAPGADVNPYLSVASILLGCIQGLKESEEPPPYATGDVKQDKRWPLLPPTMPEAIEAFRQSSSAVAGFGKEFVEHFAFVKNDEWNDFLSSVASPQEALKKAPVTPWEFQRYFNFA